MPNPDARVLLALAEAYLVERKSTWGIEVLENGKLKLPTNDKWVEDKIDALNKVLQQIVKTEQNSINHWIALAFHIHAEEMNENAKVGITTLNHMLLDLFRAMRSYIINSIKDEKGYTNKWKALKLDQTTHEDTILRLDKFTENHDQNERDQATMELENTNKQLDSLRVDSNYLTQYFNNVIATGEKYKELQETDIKSFFENAQKDLRSAELCKKLMETKNIVMQAEQNHNTSAAKTTTATPVPPTIVTVSEHSKKAKAKPSSTKAAEGPSALAKNSIYAAPSAPRKSRGKTKPQPIPLQFSSESESESPDRDNTRGTAPRSNSSRSTRSGRNY